MKRPDFLVGRNAVWNITIFIATVCALSLNFIGLIMGISIVIPHLLYIPVVIAAYRYPKQGLFFAGCIGGIYLLMVVLITSGDFKTIGEALVRTIVVVVIGWLISLLTLRLREQEALYQGLFDNSEAGSILIHVTENGRVIEEVNEKARALLEARAGDLVAAPLTTFMSSEDEEEIFSRLANTGRVEAAETVFVTPTGKLQNVLVSLASLPDNRDILTFVDITRRVNAERAVKMANDKLSLLSRISTDHLYGEINEIIGTVDKMAAKQLDRDIINFITQVRTQAVNLARRVLLTESYKDLGTSPPVWMSVQHILESANHLFSGSDVSFRFWAERLEIYADPLLEEVLLHIVENSLRHGGTVNNIVVTYQVAGKGLDLLLSDDGIGIPPEKKETIFEYDAGGHSGIGLFICRQILGVTGISITEEGKKGEGACFVIHVPDDYYRIEGTEEDAPAFPLSRNQDPTVNHGVLHKSGVWVRELTSVEFPLANQLWTDYHETRGDPRIDRIFAAFSNGEMSSLARCRKHPDGLEVDGIFTPVRYRGYGYASVAVWALVEACGNDPLYMHAVRNLTGFYERYGFVPIAEEELPPSIRKRFEWAGGAMEGANVCPMKRDASTSPKASDPR
jgi:PAS domain S-box-containing protein